MSRILKVNGDYRLQVAAGSSVPLSTVAITDTGGTFTCAFFTNGLVVGQAITITGTLSAGTILGTANYTNSAIFYIITTNGSTAFTLSATLGGAAIATTSSSGAITGTTFVVNSQGNIILDAQYNGKVTVLGDLDVKGTTTYIESTVTEIKDNILQLNYGQTGNGISSANSYVSGIEVQRGNYSAAQILFNEQVNHYDSLSGAQTTTNTAGSWSLKTAAGSTGGLQLRAIVSDGLSDIAFDMLSTTVKLAIVNVGGTIGVAGHNLETSGTNYGALNLQSYHVPNIKYLNNYVLSTYTGTPAGGQGVALTDRVMFPVVAGTTIANANASIKVSTGNIVFQVSQYTYATVDADGMTAGYVRMGGGNLINPQANTITNTSSNNLIITANNGYVEINAVTQLDNVTTSVTYNSNGTQIYSSSTVGPAKTGIYFVNASNQTKDELVSRSRAVLLSILL